MRGKGLESRMMGNYHVRFGKESSGPLHEKMRAHCETDAGKGGLVHHLGILYMLAVSSLSTYGILLAGWSANSKYAFLGSKWPNKDVILYLKQTVSEKFIERALLPLMDTLCVTPYFFVICGIINSSSMKIDKNLRGSKVKIPLKMNNPQVTKAFNSLVGTSEAIRLLSIYFLKKIHFVFIKASRSYIRVSHPENPVSKSKS